MVWVTENPEIFILVLIVLLLIVVVWRLFDGHNTAVEAPKQLEPEPEEPQEKQKEPVPVRTDEAVQAEGQEQSVDSPEQSPAESTQEEEISEPALAEEAIDAPQKEPEPAPVEDIPDTSASETRVEKPKRNFFIAALKKSRDALMGGFSSLWSGEPLDEEALEELEDTLIGADVGAQVAMEIIEELQEKSESGADGEALKAHLRALLLERIGQHQSINSVSDGPLVILVVGVNGSGKTTTIGKLAHRYIQSGKKVMVAAGDTFRAGAIEQLKVWADRSGADFISSQPKADPASVVYTALEAALARDMDVVICDTAGRLQAQSSLMEELTKVARVGKKLIPEAPHEVLLVLDATIGQNALSQAEGFNEAAELTGVVLTKLDGTAKGGVVVAVQKKLGIPVKLVGLGEGIDDLRDFSPEDFVDALLMNEEGV